MKKYHTPLFVFIVFCMVSAFIGWLSGYDFDYRSGGVALWALLTIYLGSLAAAATVS